MKKPDELAFGTSGTSRKTLPTRKARKVAKSDVPPVMKKTARKKNILDRDVEKELVRAFGEK